MGMENLAEIGGGRKAELGADVLNGTVGGYEQVNRSLAEQAKPLNIGCCSHAAAKGAVNDGFADMAMLGDLLDRTINMISHIGHCEVAERLTVVLMLIGHVGEEIGENGIKESKCFAVDWTIRGNIPQTGSQLGRRCDLLKPVILLIADG